MNAETPGSHEDMHWLAYGKMKFREWRGQRPFWAGLFTFLGGVPIAYFPYADVRLGNITIAMSTTAGAGSLIIGVLLVTLGLALWFQQTIRIFAGVAAILLALVSLPVSNFGGFLLGFLFALLGGAMALSWAPGVPQEDVADGAADPAAAAMEGGFPGPRTETGPQDGYYGHAPSVSFEKPEATETTAHANGGRNSAG
ncbi:DUF6114 domain-containing protein [Streptomyces sp. NPDC002073]|uniref:DUF6114 domain-containing protein n=1 Tax=Streptomyces sp. NBC_00239 TaxID=2903640 RepID=UPI002E2D3CB4|nr:DUF6114 domain-containing protein [Streptomyces sp. NBC_00239]